MGMLKRFVRQVRGRRYQGATNSLTNDAAPAPIELVKSRPQYEDRPHLRAYDQPRDLDTMFDKLRRDLYAKEDSPRGYLSMPRLFRESGKLDMGRPYFFLKPANSHGLLFERSGSGWVISRAEKDATRATFLRDQEPWDIATVFVREDETQSIRVQSPKTGSDPISFRVYEQILQEELEREWTQRF